jgi:hydrogenase maturation protein HypF
MPGGDQAIREPWRMALAHLHDAGISCSRWEQRLPATSRRIVERIVERPGLSPATSSMGRLFDAVASLLGVADRVADEGEAAMKLEWLAEKGAADDGLASAYPFDLRSLPGRWEIDTRPMIADLVRDVEQSREPAQVVLSGGVFLNAWLTRTALSQLRAERFTVVRHRQVPPGDGGLCLGQLAIAAARSAGGA